MVELNDKLLNDEGEEIIKETEENGGGDRNQNNRTRNDERLTPGRPRNMSELGAGILEVID
jgi:hypothetical protein